MSVTEFGVKAVPRPSAADEVRAEIERMALALVEQVRAGEITEIVMMLKHADNTWSNAWSGSLDYPRTIGQLEITKHEMISCCARAARGES